MNNDTQNNRLWNFRQIVSAAGGVNEAARIMGKKNSQITALSGPNPNRNIGDKIAARIETAFGLMPGSLDMPPPKESYATDRFLSRIAATLANASDADKEFVLHMSEWLVRRTIKDSSVQSGKLIDAKDIISL